jgi:hypothetical protein
MVRSRLKIAFRILKFLAKSRKPLMSSFGGRMASN